jgi:hypothetical protein
VASRSQTESQQLGAQQDIGELLSELAIKIERLKTLYEQYFMGIEKIEPQVARKEVTRVMLTLQQQYIRNTALRFKFNTMLQKWNIYITYWNRVLREIENGTYVRHLVKAKRAAERVGQELPPEMHTGKLRPATGSFDAIDDSPGGQVQRRRLDDDTGSHPVPGPPKTDPALEQVWERLFTDEHKGNAGATAKPAAGPPSLPPPAPSAAQARSATPPNGRPTTSRPAPGPPPPPRAALLPKIPGMSEADLRTLHQRYVDAQKAGGAAATVKYETLVSSLAKQVPRVLEQPGVKGVRFDVSVQDGKPILKAIPQK